jgi:hypothetical protein
MSDAEDSRVSDRLWGLFMDAGLIDNDEYRKRAADLFCDVSMVEDERDRWKAMHAASVKHRRKLLGLDGDGNIETFGNRIAKLLGFRS